MDLSEKIIDKKEELLDEFENLSLDEGNLLRKLLTKKGTGKGNEQKEKIYQKIHKI